MAIIHYDVIFEKHAAPTLEQFKVKVDQRMGLHTRLL